MQNICRDSRYNISRDSNTGSAHLFFISPEIEEEVNDEFHQPPLHNCETAKGKWLTIHSGWSVVTTGDSIAIADTSVRQLHEAEVIEQVKQLPSPFLGPLIPSSAANSDGWRLKETSSFSLNRITDTGRQAEDIYTDARYGSTISFTENTTLAPNKLRNGERMLSLPRNWCFLKGKDSCSVWSGKRNSVGCLDCTHRIHSCQDHRTDTPLWS